MPTGESVANGGGGPLGGGSGTRDPCRPTGMNPSQQRIEPACQATQIGPELEHQGRHDPGSAGPQRGRPAKPVEDEPEALG